MKKAILVSVLVFLLSACGGKKSPTDVELTGNLKGLPSWVISPDVEDGVAAVGIAPKSKGGLQLQMKKAETDARAGIATKIQSQISRVTKQALRESNVNGINDVEDVFSQATKEVVKDIPLSGVKKINAHEGEDGTLYIHMKLTHEDYGQYLKNSERVFEQRLRQANLSRSNLDRSQEAVKGLFDELEEERKKD